MRLLNLSAKNYRTLEDIELKLSPDYCTLSGRNNAGKSAVIRGLTYLLSEDSRSWINEQNRVDYLADHTQWVRDESPIELQCMLCLNRSDDPSLIQFIEKITSRKITEKECRLGIKSTVSPKDVSTISVTVDEIAASEAESREIVRKLKSAHVLFIHNSASSSPELYFTRGRGQALYEVDLSGEEQKQIADAGRTVRRKIKKMAKSHRIEMNRMLGKLVEKYDVEFGTFDAFSPGREMPLEISLSDKHVEVPLTDWGSGTQNRTYALMSVLKATRIKARNDESDKVTPIVLVEEPESFLHPSAQAEFGKLLQGIATELEIQIIVSTHSPFMLNQIDPSANILLRRKVVRNKLKQTEVTDTSGEHWMEPFAEHLGISAPEFKAWRGLFGGSKSRVVLVEGELDRDYFEHLRETYPDKFPVPEDVNIASYGGKDTLKNTALLKFVLSTFEKSYITYDLDSKTECDTALGRLGLEEQKDYIALGIDKPGRDAIEGLLPDAVISAVAARETGLIMQLGSTDSGERKHAKNELKKRYLSEFKSRKDHSADDLKGFFRIGQMINKAFKTK